MLIADHANLRFTLLFSIAVWSFCRFYYFAFYVINNCVDPNYKFAGLGSFLRYLLENQKTKYDMKISTKNKTAFTLLEVIIVICLIAMVALVVLPAMNPPHRGAQRIPVRQ